MVWGSLWGSPARKRAEFGGLGRMRATNEKEPKASDWQHFRLSDEVGGTGLEPVTPSLSSWQPAIPAFAIACAFSTVCRRFCFVAAAGLALVCTRSRGLVVAPGSTAHQSS